LAVLLPPVTVAAGVLGYMAIEGWSLLDSVFMTAITMTTVGFGEVHPLSPAGRVFTVVLISFGVLAIGAVVTAGTKAILEGEVDRMMGTRKRERHIQKLRDHYIICGFGRMGRVILGELRRKGIPLVVVEGNEEVYREIDEEILAVHGDATQDTVLSRVGIQQAKGLISVVSSDAGNVYVTLTARGLNPGIFIVARAGDEGSESKLIRAGADKVISPYHIGGGRIAQAILRPAVVDFIELVTGSEHLDLQMEEVEVRPRSSICRVTLPESGIRQHFNIIIVAIKKSSGHMVFNPAPETILEEGDRLIALGGKENLEKLDLIARGERSFISPPE
jgi:voltage-gated potassium channel